MTSAYRGVKANMLAQFSRLCRSFPRLSMFKFSSSLRRASAITDALELPRWDDASEQQYVKDSTRRYAYRPDLNHKIVLWQGDMTKLKIEGIVNAANSSLLGGGGIDGAIHRAAGRKLFEECRTLGRCDTGNTKVTSGYNLPAKYVLHTVGPIGENPKLLASCYRTVLEQAVEHNIPSICFCCVSTGVFGYPQRAAAKVALKTVRNWLESAPNASKIDLVVFCTFLDSDLEIYQDLLPQYFPRVDRQEPITATNDEDEERLSSDARASAEMVLGQTGEESKQTSIDGQSTTEFSGHQGTEDVTGIIDEEEKEEEGRPNASAATADLEMEVSDISEQKRMRSDAGETTSQDDGIHSQRVSECSYPESLHEVVATAGEDTQENQSGGENSGQLQQTDGEKTKEA